MTRNAAVVNTWGISMKAHYKFLLALLGAATLISCSSSEVSEQRPDTSEVESRAKSKSSARSNSTFDEFAVGKRLANPKTPTLSYDEIIDLTTGSVKPSAYKKYKDKLDEYRKMRVNGTRGLVFEASVAAEANDHLERGGQNERLLITGIEGDRSHPADLILWDDGEIKKRFQLKSTKSRDDIADFLDDDKYDGMVIVIHPEVLDEIKGWIRRQKQRGDLAWEMEILDEAIESGMLSDSVVDGVQTPSYEEALVIADQVIRQQIKAAQAQWGSTGRATPAQKRRGSGAGQTLLQTQLASINKDLFKIRNDLQTVLEDLAEMNYPGNKYYRENLNLWTVCMDFCWQLDFIRHQLKIMEQFGPRTQEIEVATSRTRSKVLFLISDFLKRQKKELEISGISDIRNELKFAQENASLVSAGEKMKTSLREMLKKLQEAIDAIGNTRV